jgi:hypothetical protein
MEHDALFLIVKKTFKIFLNALKTTLPKHKSLGVSHLRKQNHLQAHELCFKKHLALFFLSL